MVKQVVGDLIKSAKNGEFDVIAHQANCFNTMGSGIALSIKQEWPEASDVDSATIKGDVNKLGTISFTQNATPVIVNLYGQFDYWSKGVLTNYDALEKALVLLKQSYPGKKIGMPKIGSLRARGDWKIILPIIEKVFCDPEDDVTIVEWEQDVNKTATTKNSYGTQSGIIAKLSAFQTTNVNPGDSNAAPSNTSNVIGVLTSVVQSIKKKFHGKRRCRVCNQYNSVGRMINYLPGVWVDKENCNKVFVDKAVELNKNFITKIDPVIVN